MIVVMCYCYILFNIYIRPKSKATEIQKNAKEIPPSRGNNYNVHYYYYIYSIYECIILMLRVKMAWIFIFVNTVWGIWYDMMMLNNLIHNYSGDKKGPF